MVDGVDALVASPQSVPPGAGRFAGKLRGSTNRARTVVTSLAAAAAARLADADVSEGRQPANATKVAGARAQARPCQGGAGRPIFRGLGEAAAANATPRLEMAVHVAAAVGRGAVDYHRPERDVAGRADAPRVLY